MLGVEPRSTVNSSFTDAQREATTKARAAKDSVDSAWKQADSEPDTTRKREAVEEVEESRYGIDKRQPPAKRRRVGTQVDAHTVYTTDEDDDSEVEEGEADEMDGEELVVHMGSGTHSETGKEEAEYDTSLRKDKAERKSLRSYWLSKAVDLGHDSD
jgi:non-canonical poly(A) RNA polymerase PAPD5/7